MWSRDWMMLLLHTEKVEDVVAVDRFHVHTTMMTFAPMPAVAPRLTHCAAFYPETGIPGYRVPLLPQLLLFWDWHSWLLLLLASRSSQIPANKSQCESLSAKVSPNRSDPTDPAVKDFIHHSAQ